MPDPVANDLTAFRGFLDAQIAAGRSDLTPEESLALWRDQQRDFDESVAAVKLALADLDAGEQGKPLHEFFDELRARHGMLRGS